MRNFDKQLGMVAHSFWFFLLSVCTGAFLFKVITVHFLLPSGAPYFLMAAFLLPIGYLVPVLLKLYDLKEIDGINREERRRLASIVNDKARIITSMLLVLIVATVLLLVLFFVLSDKPYFYKKTFITAGGLLGAVIYLFCYSLRASCEISTFRAKLKERAENIKSKKAALKRLKSG